MFRTDENASESKVIKTKVVDLKNYRKKRQFFPAEKYHQDYFEKNKGRYSVYRFMSDEIHSRKTRGRINSTKRVGGEDKAFEAIFD